LTQVVGNQVAACTRKSREIPCEPNHLSACSSLSTSIAPVGLGLQKACAKPIFLLSKHWVSGCRIELSRQFQFFCLGPFVPVGIATNAQPLRRSSCGVMCDIFTPTTNHLLLRQLLHRLLLAHPLATNTVP
jgi:hypothetical protein